MFHELPAQNRGFADDFGQFIVTSREPNDQVPLGEVP